MERETGSDKRITRLMLPADIRFDNGAGLLGAWSREAGASLRYSTLNLSVPQIELVTIDQPTAQTDGTTRARRQIFDQGQLRGMNWITLDRDGRIIRTESPVFGSLAVTRPATQAEAQTKHPPFSLVRNAVVKAPFRVPVAAMNGHISALEAWQRGRWDCTEEAAILTTLARAAGKALMCRLANSMHRTSPLPSAMETAGLWPPETRLRG